MQTSTDYKNQLRADINAIMGIAAEASTTKTKTLREKAQTKAPKAVKTAETAKEDALETDMDSVFEEQIMTFLLAQIQKNGGRARAELLHVYPHQTQADRQVSMARLRYLQRAVERGYLRAQGERRGREYILTPKAKQGPLKVWASLADMTPRAA